MPRGPNLYRNPTLYKREGEEWDRTWFDTYDDAFNELQGPFAQSQFRGSLVSGFCWIKKEQSKPNKEGNRWWKMRCPYFNSSVLSSQAAHFLLTQNGQVLHCIRFWDESQWSLWDFQDAASTCFKDTSYWFTRQAEEEATWNHPSCFDSHTGLSLAQLVKRSSLHPSFITNNWKMTLFTCCFGWMLSCLVLLCLLLNCISWRSFLQLAQTSTFTLPSLLCVSEDTEYIARDDPDNEENQHIVSVLSSKNFLLNGYIAKQQGGLFSIHVDASHQYHKNDWLCYVPVSVTSLNQQHHILGYALTSSEDKDAHVFIFEAIQYKVEHIMKKRMSNHECQDYI